MHPFPLGTITITPTAAAALAAAGVDPHTLLARHQAGDWGELDEAERHANGLALQHGQLLISLYPLGDGPPVRVVTAGERACGLFWRGYPSNSPFAA